MIFGTNITNLKIYNNNRGGDLMSTDDEKRYVTSVYTGRYKSKGSLNNTKTFVNTKETQKKHDIMVKHNRKYRLIRKPIKLYSSLD
jgi:hypothetical protein